MPTSNANFYDSEFLRITVIIAIGYSNNFSV